MNRKRRIAVCAMALACLWARAGLPADLPPHLEQARQLFLQGMNAYFQDRYADARSLFIQARLITNYVDYAFYVGHTYDMEQNYQAALQLYTDYLNAHPNGSWAEVARQRMRVIQNPKKVTRMQPVFGSTGKGDNPYDGLPCGKDNPCRAVTEYYVEPMYKIMWQMGYPHPFVPR